MIISHHSGPGQGCFEQDGCFAFLYLPLLAEQHSMIAKLIARTPHCDRVGFARRQTGTNCASPLQQAFCPTLAEMKAAA